MTLATQQPDPELAAMECLKAFLRAAPDNVSRARRYAAIPRWASGPMLAFLRALAVS